MLIWFALLLAFFSISYVLVRAQKRVETLTTRIEVLETCQRLQDREVTELQKEGPQGLEERVQSLEETVGKPRDESDSLSDRLDTVEGQLEIIEEEEYVRFENLRDEVVCIISGEIFKISIERGRR